MLQIVWNEGCRLHRVWLEFIFAAALPVLCCVWQLRRCQQHSSVLAAAEQCWHSTKARSAAFPPLTSQAGVGRVLGGDTARRAAPN